MNIKNSLFLIAGAAIGSFITYKVVEKKYKEISDEEIASVKQMYERKMEKVEIDKNNEVQEVKDNHKKVDNTFRNNTYGSFVTDLGYSNNKEEKKEDVDINNIEIIPPEDFGENDYACESLTYYADNVLTFDNGEVITDVAKYIGPDALNTFGEYEDDSVFVRNHNMTTDFEILLDSRKYHNKVSVDSANDIDND